MGGILIPRLNRRKFPRIWTASLLFETEGQILASQAGRHHELRCSVDTRWTWVLLGRTLGPRINSNALKQLLPVISGLIQVLVELLAGRVVMLGALLFLLFGNLLLSQVFQVKKAPNLR